MFPESKCSFASTPLLPSTLPKGVLSRGMASSDFLFCNGRLVCVPWVGLVCCGLDGERLRNNNLLSAQRGLKGNLVLWTNNSSFLLYSNLLTNQKTFIHYDLFTEHLLMIGPLDEHGTCLLSRSQGGGEQQCGINTKSQGQGTNSLCRYSFMW